MAGRWLPHQLPTEPRPEFRRHIVKALAAVAVTAAPCAQAQSAAALRWMDCTLPGVSQQVRCGAVKRPLDPAQPQGRQIDVHFAWVPALARIKKPDPLVILVGGPGQSAISLAAPLTRQWVRALNRRDLLLVDQRGTGRSAPLHCEREAPTAPLAHADVDHQLARLQDCQAALRQLPHGDLRFYTTSVAMADLEAVRLALGFGPMNVVGVSYGTRAALEYQRLFPDAVRRTVLDGVAPPDMVLPASMGLDSLASWDSVLKACEAEARCRQLYGSVRLQWDSLLASLPREQTVRHPVTGQTERLVVTRDMVLSWLRLPLYVPALAAGLPHAVSEAAQGRLEPLVGLASGLAGGRQRATELAAGMHFSVVCSEDVPRLPAQTDEEVLSPSQGVTRLYRRVCAEWPRGAVADDFYRVPPSRSPVLLLSGGADPATPPRHGQRVAQVLGALARHVEVPHAGHGVLALGCMPDVVLRFLDAPGEAQALAIDASCALDVPRPGAFFPQGLPPGAGGMP